MQNASIFDKNKHNTIAFKISENNDHVITKLMLLQFALFDEKFAKGQTIDGFYSCGMPTTNIDGSYTCSVNKYQDEEKGEENRTITVKHNDADNTIEIKIDHKDSKNTEMPDNLQQEVYEKILKPILKQNQDSTAIHQSMNLDIEEEFSKYNNDNLLILPRVRLQDKEIKFFSRNFATEDDIEQCLKDSSRTLLFINESPLKPFGKTTEELTKLTTSLQETTNTTIVAQKQNQKKFMEGLVKNFKDQFDQQAVSDKISEYFSKLMLHYMNQTLFSTPSIMMDKIPRDDQNSGLAQSIRRCRLITTDSQNPHMDFEWDITYKTAEPDEPEVTRTIKYSFFPDQTMQMSMDNPNDKLQAYFENIFIALNSGDKNVDISNKDRRVDDRLEMNLLVLNHGSTNKALMREVVKTPNIANYTSEDFQSLLSTLKAKAEERMLKVKLPQFYDDKPGLQPILKDTFNLIVMEVLKKGRYKADEDGEDIFNYDELINEIEYGTTKISSIENGKVIINCSADDLLETHKDQIHGAIIKALDQKNFQSEVQAQYVKKQYDLYQHSSLHSFLSPEKMLQNGITHGVINDMATRKVLPHKITSLARAWLTKPLQINETLEFIGQYDNLDISRVAKHLKKLGIKSSDLSLIPTPNIKVQELTDALKNAETFKGKINGVCSSILHKITSNRGHKLEDFKQSLQNIQNGEFDEVNSRNIEKESRQTFGQINPPQDQRQNEPFDKVDDSIRELTSKVDGEQNIKNSLLKQEYYLNNTETGRYDQNSENIFAQPENTKITQSVLEETMEILKLGTLAQINPSQDQRQNGGNGNKKQNNPQQNKPLVYKR